MLRIAALILILANGPAFGDVILLDATARGNISPDGSESTFIFAGFVTSPERDWLEFSIPQLSETVASATLELFQPQFGHLGGNLVYSVYALSAQPTSFSDITNATLYASIPTDSSTDRSSLLITLDSAALTAIEGKQGGNFFIGGIDTGESSTSPAGDFGGAPGRSILKLTTVPEPASYFMMIAGLAAIGLFVKRKSRFLDVLVGDR